MARRTKKNVGVIGLGIIGSRVADNLRRQGFHVFVWNRNPRPVPKVPRLPALLSVGVLVGGPAGGASVTGRGDPIDDARTLLGGLTLTKHDLGKTAPEMSMLVHTRKTEILEGKAAETLDRSRKGTTAASRRRAI